MKRVPVCEFLWLDAADLEPGWGEITSYDLTYKDLTATYGLFVLEDDDWYWHASTYSEGVWAGRGKIPKAMVHSVRILEWFYYEE